MQTITSIKNKYMNICGLTDGWMILTIWWVEIRWFVGCEKIEDVKLIGALDKMVIKYSINPLVYFGKYNLLKEHNFLT